MNYVVFLLLSIASFFAIEFYLWLTPKKKMVVEESLGVVATLLWIVVIWAILSCISGVRGWLRILIGFGLLLLFCALQYVINRRRNDSDTVNENQSIGTGEENSKYNIFYLTLAALFLDILGRLVVFSAIDTMILITSATSFLLSMLLFFNILPKNKYWCKPHLLFNALISALLVVEYFSKTV